MSQDPKLDAARVKAFWERRGERFGAVPLESLANLEENPEALEIKTRLEQEKILPLVPEGPDLRLLDLGAGVGQWTFRFAGRVGHVTAVEYAESLAAIGRAESVRRGLGNVEWVVGPAETYRASRPFDVVFISGLVIYLGDAQVSALVDRVREALAPSGCVVLRDGTSTGAERYAIDNRWSERLGTHYSALYRTAPEYRTMFDALGLRCVEDGPVFEDGHFLNKFPETRLRYYVFR